MCSKLDTERSINVFMDVFYNFDLKFYFQKIQTLKFQNKFEIEYSISLFFNF